MHLPWLETRDLEQAGVMRRAIDAQAEVLCAAALGAVRAPGRTLLITDAGPPQRQMMTGISAWPERHLAAVKVTTLTPGNPAAGRALIQGLVVVMNLETGAPQLLVEGGALTGLRTGAMAGLAARHLAPSTDVLAIVGAGVQAQWSLLALMQETEFRVVRIASRGQARLEALAEWLRSRLRANQEVVIAESIKSAVEGAALVCCATSVDHPRPVVDAAWLGADTVCIALGGANETACEIDPQWVRHAQIFVEDRSQALQEAGEIRALGLGPGDLHLLSDIVSGAAPAPMRGRRLFRSVGSAALDLAGVLAVISR